jgi:hypothetical protein
MKKLYVHCGLHKTGTTALQLFLRKNTERLRSAGILYPHAGCTDSVGSGHHNLAWQMARDRRFEKGFGDFEALASEVGNFSGDVVLSSEDFESSLDSVGSLAALARYATSINRELVLVIYVRNQVSYLESLYCEMLRHGFGGEYKILARQAIDRRMLTIKEWVFHFDYLHIAQRITAIPNLRLVFRNFHALHDNSIVVDFTSILTFNPAADDDLFNLRSHERDTPAASLSLFYQNRIGRPLSRAEIEVLEHFCGDKLRQVKTGGALHDALVKAFRTRNKLFCRKYKVAREGLIFEDYSDDAVGGSALLERLFSFETQCAIQEIASLRASVESRDVDHVAVMTLAGNAIAKWWANRAAE